MEAIAATLTLACAILGTAVMVIGGAIIVSMLGFCLLRIIFQGLSQWTKDKK